MTDVRLDWGEAEVSPGGTLTVPLHDDPDERWASAFNSVLKQLLANSVGSPQRYELIRGAITVRGVTEGSEDTVHANVESLVRDANEEASKKRASAEREAEDARRFERERVEGAERMTKKFRDIPRPS